MEQETLNAHYEIFAQVSANLTAGSGQNPIKNLVPPEEVSEFAHACEALTTRAADIAAKRVKAARFAGPGLSFCEALKDVLEELGQQRDEKLWRAIA